MPHPENRLSQEEVHAAVCRARRQLADMGCRITEWERSQQALREQLAAMKANQERLIAKMQAMTARK